MNLATTSHDLLWLVCFTLIKCWIHIFSPHHNSWHRLNVDSTYCVTRKFEFSKHRTNKNRFSGHWEDRTPDLTHAKRARYHCAKCPTSSLFGTKVTSRCLIRDSHRHRGGTSFKDEMAVPEYEAEEVGPPMVTADCVAMGNPAQRVTKYERAYIIRRVRAPPLTKLNSCIRTSAAILASSQLVPSCSAERALRTSSVMRNCNSASMHQMIKFLA